METIFCNATNIENSAICLVRISGDFVFRVEAFVPAFSKLKHRMATRVKILDGDGEILDDALATYFMAPNSFTGEDVLEIALHSSPFVVGKFLELLAGLKGYRFAKGGEFCMRAFKNGKISLNEAEAINKLVLSESVVQHRLAMAEMKGAGRDFFEKIKVGILNILSLLEAYIDFSEEEELSVDFISKIEEISQNIKILLLQALKIAQKRQNCDIQIAIYGKPNVGKSSLFNVIVGEDEAIVSSIAGTTRDAIKKTINLFGFKVELVDTAGIRAGAGEIEALGIEKAKVIAKKADLVLHLKEAGEVESFEQFDGQVLNVWTKSDIHGTCSEGISISVEDISPLMKAFNGLLSERFQQMKGVGFSCNERQKAIILQAILCLEKINFQQGAEVISEQFRHVLHVVSTIVGGIDVEDVLGEVFSSFCIGK